MAKKNRYLAVYPGAGDGELVPLASYIDFLRNNGRLSAARTYERMLRPFAHWLFSRGKTLDTFTQNDVETYRRQIKNKNTSNMFFYSIRGYASYRTGALDFGDPRVIQEMQRANQLRLMRPEKPTPNEEKKYLTSAELKKVLKRVYQDSKDDTLYAAVVCQFYFGARPIELAHHLKFGEHKARIDWNKNEMMLWTAKREMFRYIPWHEDMSHYLGVWYDALPLEPPGEWLTRRLRKYQVGSLRLKAYVGRYSLQTHLRLARAEELLIDSVMGHASQSRIGDSYTSFDAFRGDMRKMMVTQHYMIKDKVI
jgi:hypothetical protein